MNCKWKECFVVAIFLLPLALAWDSEELELFDLVEEVNTNFYTLLGVEPTADSKIIRQAFKKLSLVLHPDKNDAPDADVKFRQLVAVHEILKDPAKRKRYEEVLENGLPDWRHAVYYYRRVRKMGLAEMSVILFIIVTIGQYAVSWAAYLEKKVIFEEMASVEKKRLQRKQKKGKLDQVPEISYTIPKPSIKNTLPFQIPKFMWRTIKCIPLSIKFLVEYIIEKRNKKEEEVESSSEEEIEETWSKGPRRRRNFKIPELKEESQQNGLPHVEEDTEKELESSKKPVSGGLWTDDDLAELVKLVNKFPQGTPKRWEKVAEAMGRTVYEVTIMSKKIQENIVSRSNILEEPSPEEPKKTKTKGGKLGISEELIVEKDWSQIQQKALEEALSKYPKQVSDRWDKISKSVPGKSKEECMLRFKHLHELLKKKKETDT